MKIIDRRGGAFNDIIVVSHNNKILHQWECVGSEADDQFLTIMKDMIRRLRNCEDCN